MDKRIAELQAEVKSLRREVEQQREFKHRANRVVESLQKQVAEQDQPLVEPMHCIDCETWMYTKADLADHEYCRRAHEDYVERWRQGTSGE